MKTKPLKVLLVAITFRVAAIFLVVLSIVNGAAAALVSSCLRSKSCIK